MIKRLGFLNKTRETWFIKFMGSWFKIGCQSYSVKFWERVLSLKDEIQASGKNRIIRHLKREDPDDFLFDAVYATPEGLWRCDYGEKGEDARMWYDLHKNYVKNGSEYQARHTKKNYFASWKEVERIAKALKRAGAKIDA